MTPYQKLLRLRTLQETIAEECVRKASLAVEKSTCSMQLVQDRIKGLRSSRLTHLSNGDRDGSVYDDQALSQLDNARIILSALIVRQQKMLVGVTESYRITHLETMKAKTVLDARERSTAIIKQRKCQMELDESYLLTHRRRNDETAQGEPQDHNSNK